MKKDLRGSPAAKTAAAVLALALALAALLGGYAAMLLAEGYGIADSYGEDRLSRPSMERAMELAWRYVTHSPGWASAGEELQGGEYTGFSAQVYEGDGAKLAGVWGNVPASYLARRTMSYDGCTVVGYLETVPASSCFAVTFQFYGVLRLLQPPGGLVTAVCLLALAAALPVAFLLRAAGHRRGREEISPNWLDLIPLDLYLSAAVFLFSLALAPALSFADFFRYVSKASAAIALAALVLGLLAAESVVLACLLTFATRLKLGGWWRNTVCFLVLRLCWRVCKWACRQVRRFIQALPLTWRVVALAGGALAAQSVLTLLFIGGLGFPGFAAIVVMDLLLAAWAAAVSLQFGKVRDLGAALAAGDLEAKLDTRGLFKDMRTHAEHLNAIGVGMNKAVAQRMKSERLKTELITNVSHDIKTPLTSIINYVDLLKKETLPAAAAEYLAVLDRQSNRLKKLTEDLVEASKASTGNIAVNMEPIVVNELVHQAIGDYDEKLSAGRLEVIINSYEGALKAMADGRLLWRVLDNLLGNICKYALAGTRVYVDLGLRDGRVFLSLKNISREALNVSADELMERFVRGDASRHTEGSGLGLNIAKSLMDLMGGGFALSVDGDLFKAELTLAPAPATSPAPPARPSVPPFPAE